MQFSAGEPPIGALQQPYDGSRELAPNFKIVACRPRLQVWLTGHRDGDGGQGGLADSAIAAGLLGFVQCPISFAERCVKG